MPKAQVNGVYWYYERKIHHEITPLYGNLCYFCVLSGVVHDFLFITFIPQMQSMQGAVSIRKTVLPGMAIPMLKIRRPNGRLIFNMEIAIRR